ncbi:hypothetical protein ACJX0J_013616, partial [Zea mays]
MLHTPLTTSLKNKKELYKAFRMHIKCHLHLCIAFHHYFRYENTIGIEHIIEIPLWRFLVGVSNSDGD